MKIMLATAALTAVGALTAIPAGEAAAQDMVYRPKNPSFGGNPFNSDHLRALAEIQRQAERRRFDTDPIDDFSDTLQRRLLSELARDITDAIFGENPQEEGTFTIEGLIVSFRRIGGQVEVTIDDGETRTTISLPSTQF